MLFALMLSVIQSAPTTIELSRGAVLAADPNLRYWDTQDTTLEAAAPETNFGGDLTLRGGPTRTILIRFGDLRRVIGSGRVVTGARLVLTTSGGPTPVFRGISRLLVPWGEGPMTSIVKALMGTPDLTAKSVVVPNAATWRERRGGKYAWTGPGANGGTDAESLDGVSAKSVDSQWTLTGLTKAVQAMVDRPEQNFGFALRFDGGEEFFSAQSPGHRPILQLDLADAPTSSGADLSVTLIEKGSAEGGETSFVAHVRNVGSAEASRFSYSWVIGERVGSSVLVETKLAPGAETTFSIKRPTKPSIDHRQNPLGFRLIPNSDDVNPANDELRVDENAMFLRLVVPTGIVGPVGINARGSQDLEDWAQAQVSIFNENYLAQSRFSFAPDGALERVAIQAVGRSGDGVSMAAPSVGTGVELTWMSQFAAALGLSRLAYSPLTRARLAEWSISPDLSVSEDRFPGLLGYGDTRFEGSLPYAVAVPYEPFFSENRMTDLLEPTDMLSASDVAQFNARVSGVPIRLPNSILIRALDLAGHPIVNGKLTFRAALGNPLAFVDLPTTATTGSTGTFLLPSYGEDGPFKVGKDRPAEGLLLATLTANGQTSNAWIKSWQLLDAANRGNRAVCIADLRFNICDAELDPSVNLATDRLVTDSLASDASKLAAMTDGRPETATSLGEKPGDWFEIDLGRDRTIGELDLNLGANTFWRQFNVIGYATGQSVSGQAPILREADFEWTRRNRGVGAGMNYRFPALRVRYLRFVNVSGGVAAIRELAIRPAKISGS